jgi:hypothetical protein
MLATGRYGRLTSGLAPAYLALPPAVSTGARVLGTYDERGLSAASRHPFRDVRAGSNVGAYARAQVVNANRQPSLAIPLG